MTKKPSLTLVVDDDPRIFPDAARRSGPFTTCVRANMSVDLTLDEGDEKRTMAISFDSLNGVIQALSHAQFVLKSFKDRVTGAAKFVITERDGKLFVTHMRQTFPVRRATFRRPRRCWGCEDRSILGGYVVVHEPWAGPNFWSKAVVCHACAIRSLSVPPGQKPRQVKP